jgi:hypothetical protein
MHQTNQKYIAKPRMLLISLVFARNSQINHILIPVRATCQTVVVKYP